METPRRTITKPSSIKEPIRSAKRYGLGETGLAGFLVLAVHVFRGLGQGHHGGVEIDAVSRRDLIAGDRESSPSLDCAKRTSLDARNLHVTGDWVACHSQVMLQSRFRSIFNYTRFGIVNSRDQCRSHRRRHAYLFLAPPLRRRH